MKIQIDGPDTEKQFPCRLYVINISQVGKLSTRNRNKVYFILLLNYPAKMYFFLFYTQ